MQMRLLREGILTEEQINALEHELDHEAEEAAERALQAVPPTVESITEHVYSEDLDPTSSLFATEHVGALGSAGGGKTGGEKGRAPRTMADLINACLHDEMRRDPRIVLYGEDVQTYRRPANGIRFRARLQLSSGRGKHCGPRRWVCGARHEAGG